MFQPKSEKLKVSDEKSQKKKCMPLFIDEVDTINAGSWKANDEGDDPTTGVRKGDKTGVGISLTPANELAHLEVRINRKMDIWFWDYDSDRSTTNRENMDNPKCLYKGITFFPALFEILYGIIWELSFHGHPEQREDDRKELCRRMDQAKKGTIKTIPWKENRGTSQKEPRSQSLTFKMT